MDYEISFAGVGLIFLDVLMLWACWMVRRHLALIEHEEKTSALEETRYFQHVLMLMKEHPHRSENEIHVFDE